MELILITRVVPHKLQVWVLLILFIAVALLAGCSDIPQSAVVTQSEPTMTSESTQDIPEREMTVPTEGAPMPTKNQPLLADVISVQVTGSAGAYQFSVGVSSPDTGCEQYADWWEVVSEQGELVYRRVLLHSHVAEQPFVRSGGSVNIDADTIVWVRAHMAPGGYGGLAFHGSVQAGFTQAELPQDFAPDLEFETPLPDGCAF